MIFCIGVLDEYQEFGHKGEYFYISEHILSKILQYKLHLHEFVGRSTTKRRRTTENDSV